MKRIIRLSVCTFVTFLLLTGCGTNNVEPTNEHEPTSEQQETVTDVVEENNETVELKEPVLQWWELYNPNGFDTITAKISNPNNVSIDVTYDLVYYKEGKEVARSELFSNFSILPDGDDLIWANFDIPKSDDVDDIKMENVVVTETAYQPIKGTYEYIGTDNGEATYEFKFESAPSLANIWFLQYNDNNGNGQFDKGEIVIVSVGSLMEQQGTVCYDVEAENCEVDFTAN